MSPGGFLCGHDYTHGYRSSSSLGYSGGSRVTYGVIEAVGEFLLHNPDYTLAFVTTEHERSGHGSFCMMRVRIDDLRTRKNTPSKRAPESTQPA